MFGDQSSPKIQEQKLSVEFIENTIGMGESPVPIIFVKIFF